MSVLRKPLSLIGGLLGLVAAVLWFLAARSQPTKPESIIVDGGNIDDSGSGGLFYDEKFMSKSATANKLNAWAAGVTGISVLIATAGSLLDL